MPICPCPQCHMPVPRWLEATSKDATVNYYRCNACGHVWTVPKDDPNAPPNDVTTRREHV